LGVLVLLALPLVRFILVHPSQYTDRLRMYGSFLVENIPASQKFGRYLSNYLYGLSPVYWFFPNNHDIPRYVMKGYGHLGWWLLPFFLIGLWRAIRRFKQPAYRMLPLFLLAAPAGAATVGITVNRMIMVAIPAALLAALGLTTCLDWLAQRWKAGKAVLPAAAFAVLALAQVLMLRDVLVNGPTWYSNYGLSGMQYGARQVFQAADRYQKAHPEMMVYVSPNWTFQGDTLRRFFVPDNPSVRVGTADAFQREIKPEIAATLFVLTPSDFEAVQASQRFDPPQVEETITLPNGQPGFYFSRLQYRADIDQVVAAEASRRHVLEYGMVTIQGEQVKVGTPALDMGSAQNAFDGNLDTLLRTREANPLTLDLEFNSPRQVSGVVLRVGSETVDVTVTLTLPGSTEPIIYTRRAGEGDGYKDVAVDFNAPVKVVRLRIDLLDTYAPDPSNVHLWEVTLK